MSTLAELGAGEFKVQALPLVTDGTQPSSSTPIRHAVAEGDFGRVRAQRQRLPVLRCCGTR